MVFSSTSPWTARWVSKVRTSSNYRSKRSTTRFIFTTGQISVISEIGLTEMLLFSWARWRLLSATAKLYHMYKAFWRSQTEFYFRLDLEKLCASLAAPSRYPCLHRSFDKGSLIFQLFILKRSKMIPKNSYKWYRGKTSCYFYYDME